MERVKTKPLLNSRDSGLGGRSGDQVPTVSHSAHKVARVVRFTPGITRQGVADRLGMSVTTVNPLVAQLIDLEVLHEAGPAPLEARRGRPRAGLHFRGDRDSLGIVLWSHGVLDIALATFDGEVVWRRSTDVLSHPHSEDIIDAADQLFAAADNQQGVSVPYCLVLGLPAPYERGVGLPGAAESNPATKSADTVDNFSAWFVADPLSILSSRFEVPVLVVNDANLGALGEARDGLVVGAKCLISVKMTGSGIGAGIAVNGDLFEGSHGFAGEIAHVRVDDDSTTICACGSRGCLEEKLGNALLDPLKPTYGDDITYRRLLELVDVDAPGPVRILQDAGRTVGRVLAGMATYFNPDVIVFDAGSPRASDIVLQGVAEQVQQSAPPFIRNNLRLMHTTLQDEAPVRGAIHVARAAVTRPPAKKRTRR